MNNDDFLPKVTLQPGTRVLIEVELTKPLDAWENTSTLTNSLFLEQPINEEFIVKQIFFDTDARTILRGYINQVREHLDELENDLKL
jgi:hypothetical protein